MAIRLDRPNAYRERSQIRNIYAGNSSIVGRFLLTCPGPFRQVNEIVAGIESRGGGVSLPTVSKVLNTLADDLIITKTQGKIELIQPRKLLERLRDAYNPPKVLASLRLKLPAGHREIEGLLSESLHDQWIWSDESSAEAYAVTTTLQHRTAITSADRDRLRRLQEFEETRFFNCTVNVSMESFIYFARNGHWASRIECYLALSRLDKREREIAADIERTILGDIDGDSGRSSPGAGSPESGLQVS